MIFQHLHDAVPVTFQGSTTQVQCAQIFENALADFKNCENTIFNKHVNYFVKK